jgi:CRISPR-associated protein Cas1
MRLARYERPFPTIPAVGCLLLMTCGCADRLLLYPSTRPMDASGAERRTIEHAGRPGRPSLALDLIEEFRAFVADRVALSLINRQQVRPGGFTRDEAGGVSMNDDTRKTVLTEYQRRKQETIVHPFLGEETTVGLLVHLQARLLARYLRGELDAYPPFVAR